MDVAPVLLRAHALFVKWRRHKHAVLRLVEHLFTENHHLRIAICCALCGDPLAQFTLQADDAACRLAVAVGDSEFARLCGGRATELFYGAPPRALSEAEPATMSHRRHSQWLRLTDYIAIIDAEHYARAFMDSVRALTALPRITAKLDSCESCFGGSWRHVLAALRGVRKDLASACDIDLVLRRRGLPANISHEILALVVEWPQTIDQIDQAHRKKRRRKV